MCASLQKRKLYDFDMLIKDIIRRKGMLGRQGSRRTALHEKEGWGTRFEEFETCVQGNEGPCGNIHGVKPKSPNKG